MIGVVRPRGARLRALVLALGLLAIHPLARADAVADWNRTALASAVASGQHLEDGFQAMAIVHVAIFEVINFIHGGYAPRYVVKLPEPLTTSSEAAVAAAAHYVLTQLYPKQKSALDIALGRSLTAVPDGQQKTSGVITGRSLGANIYAIWARDQGPNAPGRETTDFGSVASGLAWHRIAAKLIDVRGIASIEGARIHALVAMAANDAYKEIALPGTRAPRSLPCASCAVGAAVLAILDSELGPAEAAQTGLAVARAADLVSESTSVSDAANVSSSARAQRVDYEKSFNADEELGRRIGMQTLTYYRADSSIEATHHPGR